MFGVLVLILFVGFVLLIPLVIVGLALRLLFGILLLPIKLAGLAFKLSLGLLAGTVGLVFGVVAFVAVLVVAGAVLLIPLLPLLFAAGGIWLIWRMARRKPAAGLTTV